MHDVGKADKIAQATLSEIFALFLLRTICYYCNSNSQSFDFVGCLTLLFIEKLQVQESSRHEI